MGPVSTAATSRPPAGRAAPRGPAVLRPAARPSVDELRRQELAAFLCSRQARLSPADVGLPDVGRRRTPAPVA